MSLITTSCLSISSATVCLSFRKRTAKKIVNPCVQCESRHETVPLKHRRSYAPKCQRNPLQHSSLIWHRLGGLCEQDAHIAPCAWHFATAVMPTVRTRNVALLCVPLVDGETGLARPTVVALSTNHQVEPALGLAFGQYRHSSLANT